MELATAAHHFCDGKPQEGFAVLPSTQQLKYVRADGREAYQLATMDMHCHSPDITQAWF